MRRRGNKSSKVPNVKLRPAEKGSIHGPIVESCWAQETQVGSDDTVMYDLCPRPFKNLVICATGVPDKPALFKRAAELGATITHAFTDRVTHLVAMNHGGAKYTCALDRKIPIIKPSWITECHQVWLRGDDVDVAKSTDAHRLPIFSGVVVCPSGITDITRRTKISKLVAAHEGGYLAKLERPVKVTHLLCSGDGETDKMSYAEKFNSRGEAMIHLVWEEWFWDSLDFGGRFDEAKYQVCHPRPERKTLAAASIPPPASSEVGSQHDQAPSSSAPSNQPPPQNDAEEAGDEPAFLNVLPTVTLQLWGTLLGRRGYEITDGEVLLSPSKVKEIEGVAKRMLPPPSSPTRPEIPEGGSVISSFRRANSFAPVVPSKEPGSSRQMPFRRTATTGAFARAGSGPSTTPIQPAVDVQSLREGHPTTSNGRNAIAGPSTSTPAQPSRIFSGMTFRALGEAKTAAVRGAVEQLGGSISTNEDEDVTFILVRLVSGSKIYQQEEDDNLKLKYRTECWLEHCIYEDRVCAPEEQISFIPLSISIPVNGAQNVLMSISGFDQSESCSLKRLLRALGITLASTFTRRSTHLLCPSGTGLKFDKAQEWNVPVVGTDWLGAMARDGRIPQAHDFMVQGFVAPQLPVSVTEVMDVDGCRKDAKGKGKAVNKGRGRAGSEDVGGAMDVDVEGKMCDITNNTPPEEHPQGPVPPDKPPKPTIDRQATTIIVNPDPPEKGSMFGQPSGILGRASSSFFEQQRQYSSLPQSMSSPDRSLAASMRQESFTMQSSKGDANSIDGTPRRSAGRTQSDLEHDIIPSSSPGGQIPSSRTPSPMKAPLQKGGSMRLSLSPAKIDHEATKALQESITSLLGKRPSPDVDELGGVVAIGGAGHVQGGRNGNGKRLRPQRSKPQTRQSSDLKIGEQSKPTPPKPRGRSSRIAPPRDVPYGEDPFASYPDELNLADLDSQPESIRVMYEDPGQRDEKRRLMSLLKGQNTTEDELPLSGSMGLERRRSTRIAGF